MRYTNIPDAARKYHFWRGVRSAAIVLVPVIIVLLVVCNIAIDAMLAI